MSDATKNRYKYWTLFVFGMALCVIPPVIATAQFFPFWRTSNAKSISGMAVILIVISCIPVWKHAKRALKSPSAWKIWCIVFVFCAVTKDIIADMYVIAAVGLLSSLLGSVVFSAAKKYRKEDSSQEE